MKPVARFLHSIYRKAVGIFLSLGCDFCLWKEEEPPEGPKIFVSNHFSSSDAHFVTTLMKDPLHMVIGPGFNVRLLRLYLKWTEQVPANTKEARGKVVERCASYLDEGDSIYIFPEGRLNPGREMLDFHMGAARLHIATGCPIVPIGLVAPMRRMRKKEGAFVGHSLTVVSRNYYADMGRAMDFPEERELAKTAPELAEKIITGKIKAEVARLIDDIMKDKFWS